MRVGWAADYPPYVGGAELTARDFRAWKSDGTVIKTITPESERVAVDVVVLHNCTEFNMDHVHLFAGKPLVKYVHDIWNQGDQDFKNWVLSHASAIIFTSQLHRDFVTRHWSEDLHKKAIIVPPWIDVEGFRALTAQMPDENRTGVIWLGRISPEKGIPNVVKWAHTHQQVVDFWGTGAHNLLVPKDDPFIQYHGPVVMESLPHLLASYESFIHLPYQLEPFGRGVAEAYACGCNLITPAHKSLIGALEYCNSELEMYMNDARQNFWKVVELAAD